MEELIKQAYRNWMLENHLYFVIIVGTLKITLTILFLASIVLVWFISFWWKVGLTIVVAYVIFDRVAGFYGDKYFDEFIKSDK